MTYTCGIYGIFDLDGTCLYVGQSRTIEERWNRHLITLKAGNHKRAEFVEWFQSKDSDVSSMKFQVMEELISDCDESILNEREIHWFYELKPLFYGKVPSTKETWRHSEETRKKISAGRRKYLEANPPSSGNYKHSEESKAKISAALRKRYGTPKAKPSRKREPKVREQLPCAGCGKMFTSPAKEYTRVYCSDKCRFPLKGSLTEEAMKDLIEKSKTISLRKLAPDYGVSHVALYKLIKKYQNGA